MGYRLSFTMPTKAEALAELNRLEAVGDTLNSAAAEGARHALARLPEGGVRVVLQGYGVNCQTEVSST